MTVDEFVAEVRALKLRWHKSGEAVRCDSGDCPLIALARAKGIQTPPLPNFSKWSNGDYHYAAKKLGIAYHDSSAIALAADWEGSLLRPKIEMLLEV